MLPALQHFRRNAVAYVALFVALGGTSYAAINLPANSVGHKELRKNAVTSRNVRDGSLRARDFKASELPQGARGPTGPAGPAGIPGASTATFWAVVRADGTLVRGSGVTGTSRANPGSYGVAFNQSVVNCAEVVSVSGYTKSPESAVPAPGLAQSWVSATGPEILTRTVNVATENTSGTLEDRPFHVVVFC